MLTLVVLGWARPDGRAIDMVGRLNDILFHRLVLAERQVEVKIELHCHQRSNDDCEFG